MEINIKTSFNIAKMLALLGIKEITTITPEEVEENQQTGGKLTPNPKE